MNVARRSRFTFAVLCFVGSFLLFDATWAQCLRTVPVSSTSALNSALAGALPGDCIVLANGTYSGVTVTKSGDAANPITISAANQGQAVFTSGIFQLNNASYVTIEGLDFTTPGGSLSVDGTSRNVALVMVGATNCRVSRCTFSLVSPPSATYWTFL